LPEDSETYLHRIGRTARSGKKGIAIVLLSDKDYDNMSKIRKELKQDIEKKESPKFEAIKIDFKMGNRNVSPKSFNSRRFSKDEHPRNSRFGGMHKRNRQRFGNK
jgi:superfamily II DNA/RNA helicase